MPKYDKYKKAYEKNLTKAENKILPKIKRFYKQEYQKGVNNFIETNETNYQSLFQYSYIKEFYSELYKSIGLDMAQWYVNNYKKYLKKSEGLKSNININFSFNDISHIYNSLIIINNLCCMLL